MQYRRGGDAEQEVKRKSQEAHNEQQHFVEGGALIAVDVPVFGHSDPHCECGKAEAEAEPEPARGLTPVQHYGDPLMPEACRRALLGPAQSRGTAMARSEHEPHERANLSRNDESECEQDIAFGVIGLGCFGRQADT